MSLYKQCVWMQHILISSRALMIDLISAVNMGAESGNLMEITVFDGKTVAQVTEFPSREPSVYIITVPFLYFHEKHMINRCTCAISDPAQSLVV